MTEIKITAPAWTEEADRLGKQALLDGEARLRAGRTPADLARTYRSPADLLRLAELQTDVDKAVAAGAEALQLQAEEMRRGEGGTGAVMVGGLLTARSPSDGGFDGAASSASQRSLDKALLAEGEARGRLSDYELELAAAGQARWLKASK